MDAADAWGQLVCTTDTDTPPMHISKDRFSIGRSSTCDVSLHDNKLVSGCHCYLQRDDSGDVWLYDNSTNGTLLNMFEKLTKGECRKLSHGDEFFVVFKKNNESLNVGYVYQDMAELGKEADETLDSTNDLDTTLRDDDLNVATTAKRKIEEDDENVIVKKLKSSLDSGPSTKVVDTDDYSGNTVSLECSAAPPGDEVEKEERKSETENRKDEEDKNGDSSKKVDIVEKEPKKASSSEVGNSESKEKRKDLKRDEIAETLMCVVCQDILHDCISLQPCMHTFCAGCYSEWSSQADDCPSCRVKVSRISKNHIVNNLVEAYVKEHPELKRSEEDLKELDSKNKITRDMIYNDLKTKSEFDECYSDMSDDSNSEDYDDSEPRPADIHPFPDAGLFGHVYRPPPTICRQCPNYQGNKAPATGGFGRFVTAAVRAVINIATTSAAPSTSGEATGADEPQATTSDGDDEKKRMPTAPTYICGVNQNHMLCCCCSQPMPDRRTDSIKQKEADIPGQQCSICYRSYCHAYWGCQQPTCMGCLGKFRDLNFGKKCLPGLILDNVYESDIFKNYLESKSISVKSVLTTCLEKLDSAVFSCVDQARFRIDSNTLLCYPCGLRNFKDLAFQYRSSIPDDQLPATVTARPICYWGKNCRTQKNKPHHAARFNHICDQVRTQ